MQARNLTEEDCQKFEDFFKEEILPYNPNAILEHILVKSRIDAKSEKLKAKSR